MGTNRGRRSVARDLQIKQMIIGALFVGTLLLVGAIARQGYDFGIFLRSLH